MEIKPLINSAYYPDPKPGRMTGAIDTKLLSTSQFLEDYPGYRIIPQGDWPIGKIVKKFERIRWTRMA